MSSDYMPAQVRSLSLRKQTLPLTFIVRGKPVNVSCELYRSEIVHLVVAISQLEKYLGIFTQKFMSFDGESSHISKSHILYAKKIGKDQFLSDFRKLYTKLFQKALVIIKKFKKIYQRGLRGGLSPRNKLFSRKFECQGG